MNFILEKARVPTISNTYVPFMCEGCLTHINDGEMMRRLEHSAHYSHDNDECFQKMIENIDRRI